MRVARTSMKPALLSYFGNLTRAADKEGKDLKNGNKILEKTSGTLLNITMLTARLA